MQNCMCRFAAKQFRRRHDSDCSEEVRTIEEIYEPYLIQCGLLKRTPRGRMVTAKAYRHLNLLLR